jgi:predicted metal-dependent phosphoesterase TrpH
MGSLIDLHVHSTASDGRKSPAGVVQLAFARNVRAIALTDHDTTHGYAEARAAGEALGVRVLAGVEVNTDSSLGEAHLLGYFADPQQSTLQSTLQRLRQKRVERAEEIIRKLNRAGVPITMDQVRAGNAQTVITRSHIGQALVDGGYVANKPAAFELYLGQGRPAYVPRYDYDPRQAIELIRSARGIVSLAHPIRSGNIEHIPALVDMGLQALETYYFNHTSEDAAALKAMADRFGLLRTGGSDFHQERKDGLRGLGSVWVPEPDGERLWEAVFAAGG